MIGTITVSPGPFGFGYSLPSRNTTSRSYSLTTLIADARKLITISKTNTDARMSSSPAILHHSGGTGGVD